MTVLASLMRHDQNAFKVWPDGKFDSDQEIDNPAGQPLQKWFRSV